MCEIREEREDKQENYKRSCDGNPGQKLKS